MRAVVRKMDSRTRFRLGLLLLNVGVLLVAWVTWCKRSTFSYSWTSPSEKFWKGLTHEHDLGLCFLTALVGAVVSTGAFYCVDALVWSKSPETLGRGD